MKEELKICSLREFDPYQEFDAPLKVEFRITM